MIIRVSSTRLTKALAALFALCCLCGTAQASGVIVAWDPNTEDGILGYHLLYGTSSGSYTDMIDVTIGNSTVVNELSDGGQYFFVVTAYTANTESVQSAELNYTVPVPSPTPSPTETPTPTASPTATPIPTATPTPTPTPTPTATPKPTPTPRPTATPRHTPRPTPTPKARPNPTAVPPGKTLLNVSAQVQVESGAFSSAG